MVQSYNLKVTRHRIKQQKCSLCLEKLGKQVLVLSLMISGKLDCNKTPVFGHEKGMNSMKLVIPLHWLYWSIHTKDESKRGTAFAFIFGVN